MELPLWALFILTFSSVLILPGPNSAFAVGQSLKYGVLGSIMVPLGFMTATGIHGILVFSGLGVAIGEYSILLEALKWFGVLYLLYLAFKSFTSKPSRLKVSPQEIPQIKMYFSALFVSLTNPKALLASIMIYPLFVSTKDSYLLQAAILALTAMAISFLVYGLYSVAATALNRRLSTSSLANKVVGSLYLGAASVLSCK